MSFRVKPMPLYEDVNGYCVVDENNISQGDFADIETALLFAAAPELLKSLTQVLDIAINYASETRPDAGDLNSTGERKVEELPWVKRARCAITKATGQ